MSDIRISELGLVTALGTADIVPTVQDGVTSKVTGQEIADSVKVMANLVDQAYVDTAISNLIDGAPAMLDTLKELAGAMHNNPEFYNDLQGAINNSVQDSDFQSYFDNAFAGKNTYHLVEGSNLYFTAERAVEAIQHTSPEFVKVTITGDVVDATDAATKNYVDSQVNSTTINNTDNLPEGNTNLYFTNARAIAAVGNINSGGSIDGGTADTVYSNAGINIDGGGA
jgi:hypothetical protein